VLELDELWSFVGSIANARWVWIALCRQTRQIVAFFVGDHSAESARALRERIPLRLPLPGNTQRLLAGL
jgi:insertion element IS1 protein InsB